MHGAQKLGKAGVRNCGTVESIGRGAIFMKCSAKQRYNRSNVSRPRPSILGLLYRRVRAERHSTPIRWLIMVCCAPESSTGTADQMKRVSHNSYADITVLLQVSLIHAEDNYVS